MGGIVVSHSSRQVPRDEWGTRSIVLAHPCRKERVMDGAPAVLCSPTHRAKCRAMNGAPGVVLAHFGVGGCGKMLALVVRSVICIEHSIRFGGSDFMQSG